MNHRRFFGDMSVSEIKQMFLKNGFSKEELKQIEVGDYDPYKEY